MKIKSHPSKWAMALCALALFSFTAQAAIQPDGLPPGPTVPPPTVSVSSVKIGRIQPLPAIQPPVNSGTFNGTVTD